MIRPDAWNTKVKEKSLVQAEKLDGMWHCNKNDFAGSFKGSLGSEWVIDFA